MAPNTGSAERIARLFLGVALLWAVSITTSGIVMWIGIAISVGIALSGAVGICPIYGALGIRTNRSSESES
jgi:hypothetical protein